jgi:hypothetical protein
VASEFITNFLGLHHSQVTLNNSRFSDSKNELIAGLAIYSEESNINVTKTQFMNLTAHSGSAIMFK